MIISKIKRKKRIKEWLVKDYEESLEYHYAQKLKKYKFNPLEVTIWYIDAQNNYIQFVSNSKYYELRDNKINQIDQKDVWIKKVRYNDTKKDSR